MLLGHHDDLLTVGCPQFLCVRPNPLVCSVCWNKSRVVSISPSWCSQASCPFCLPSISYGWAGGWNPEDAAIQKLPLPSPWGFPPPPTTTRHLLQACFQRYLVLWIPPSSEVLGSMSVFFCPGLRFSGLRSYFSSGAQFILSLPPFLYSSQEITSESVCKVLVL